MKKIISVLLIVSIIFLSGCSAVFAPKAGLIEIMDLGADVSEIRSAHFGGKYWVVLAAIWVPRQAQGNHGESDIADPGPEGQLGGEPLGEYFYRLALVNARNGKTLQSTDIKDCPLEDVYGVKYEEDGNITIFDNWHKKCVRYSPDLKPLSDAAQPYTAVDMEEELKSYPFVDYSFSQYGTFAQYYYEYFKNERINAFVFYGDKNSVYFADKERFSPYCGDGKRILGTLIKDGESPVETVKVYDFATRVVINELQTPDFGENKVTSIVYSAICGDKVFLSLEEGIPGEESDEQAQFQKHFYLWNYTLEAKNTAFDVVAKGIYDMVKGNEDICRRFFETYEIDVHINEANDETTYKDEVYALDLTASSFQVYTVLRGMEAFFSKLPEGFLKETFNGMEHIHTAGFDIYIAREVKGYPTAYASRWGDSFEIALAANSFNISTLAHEFMHIMDARLEDYYWEENLDDLWNRYNPDGFEYLGYEEENPAPWEELDYSKYDTVFASSYGMSAATEDRADTFSSLFEYGTGDFDTEPYWYKAGTPAAKKAQFLCKAIRAAYPCMKEASVQPWEKSIEH